MICRQAELAVEQTLEMPVIWDSMTLICRHWEQYMQYCLPSESVKPNKTSWKINVYNYKSFIHI